MSVPFLALFLVGWSLLSVSVAEPSSSGSVVYIASCFALRHELNRPSGNKTLILNRNLHCGVGEWPYPVTVSQDKIIRGEQAEHLWTLDLSDLNNGRGIIVNPHTRLVLDGLVLPDRQENDEENFSLSYVHGLDNSTIAIARSFIVYPACNHIKKRTVSAITESIQGCFHVCGTWQLCEELDPLNEHYIVDRTMEEACRFSNTLTKDIQDDEDVDRKEQPINSIIVLIALLFLILGFAVMGGIIVWMCRSKESSARVLDTYFHKEEKSFSESGSTEVDFSMSLRLVAIDDFSIDLDQQLGVGGFGTVFAGKFQNQRAAVKVIKSSDVPDGRDACEEANLSIGFSHPNVIKCYATRQVKIKDLFGEQHPQGDDDCTLIFLEYCDKGELSRAIDRGEYVLNFESLQPKMCSILHCALDIAKGLQYLHSNSIVHGDIKPDNILLKTDELDPRGYICKICDFGLSKKLENAATRTDTLGMISYMPPEMLRKGRIGRFTDVYSFGMLLWEMVTSDVPYSEVDYNQILSEAVNGRRPAIPDSTPPTIKNLIKSCWISDYHRRPITTDIIRRLHMALSEWYSSFPMHPATSAIPRWLRASSRRSDRHSILNSTLYAESLYSDTALEEPRESRIPQNIVKSHSTCIHSESTGQDLLLSSAGVMGSTTIDMHGDGERAPISSHTQSLHHTTSDAGDLEERPLDASLTSIHVDQAVPP